MLFLEVYSTILCWDHVKFPSVEEVNDLPAKQTHARNWSVFDKHACFVKRAPVSGIHFLFSMVILFFYRGNFELVSIENGRVNFKEQNEQFLFF